MQRMGLTATEFAAYLDTLRSSHTKSIRVTVLDLDGDVRASITPRVLDGQVVVDTGGDVTRKLTMSFLDPRHTLNFDSDSPDDGALFADRMLQVEYTVYVPALDRHVSCPVFTGVITSLQRNGGVVDVEAEGKERLALGAAWRPYTVKKGTKKVEAIRSILDERAGETLFALPTLATRLPKTVSLGRMAQPWKIARRIASSMDRQLFYRGNGVCMLRRYPGTPLHTFKVGTDVLGDVAVSYSMGDFVNVVEVIGGKPKGAKKRVRGIAVAPTSHPLSPARLGRNGVPRRLVLRVENDHIRSHAEANRKAKRILEDRLRQTVEVTFDALPMPHLEEGDLVRVQTPDSVVAFRLRQFSIPLTTDGDPVMSVGYLKRTRRYMKRAR